MNARFPFAVVALALFGPGFARAEMVDFSYTLSVSPQVISGMRVQANSEYSPSGTVSMSLGSTTEIIHEGGNYIPGSARGPMVGGVYWYFRAPPGTPQEAELGYVDTTANVKLSLTDLASGRSGQIDAVAHFQGWAGGAGDYPIQPTFSSSPTTRQTLQLGDHLYQVLPSALNVTGIPEISSGFYFQFQVTVTSVQTPEPSSLALSAIAGLGLAARRWRGRRSAGERR